jgi:hypothetical protein
MNRYYRPSAPRYTSQFVEEQYPMDLIMQAGALKYQNKQKIGQEMSDFSAQASLLQPGYRTIELAPQIQNKYLKSIDDVTAKFANNYDTPEAIAEFSKLRSMWLRDPDVQLVKNDYTIGNKQWDEMRKSPTFAMDYKGTNVNQQTGMLNQFKSGQTYKDYSPVIPYVNIEEEALKRYGAVPSRLESRRGIETITDPETGQKLKLFTQGEAEIRDDNELRKVTDNFADEIMQGSTQAGSYARAVMQQAKGSPLTKEDIVNYLSRLEPEREVRKPNMQSQVLGSGFGSSDEDVNKGVDMPLEMANKPSLYNKGSRSKVRQLQLDIISGKPGASVEDDDEIYNMYNKLIATKEISPDASIRDIKRTLNKYIKDKAGEKYFLNLSLHGNEAEDALNKGFGGGTVKDGYVTETGAASLIRGARLFDYDTGEEVINVDKKGKLLTKDTQFRVLGSVSRDNWADQPVAGGIVIESTIGGDSKRFIIQSPELAQKQKAKYNLEGYKRAYDTQIGDVFAMQFGSGGYKFVDTSDIGNDWDEEKVRVGGQNVVYAKSMIDYSDNGEVKVKVYADNPMMGKGNEKLSNKGLFNNESNPLFIKEYKLSDYGGDMDALLKDGILHDVYDTGDTPLNIINQRMNILNSMMTQQ